MANRLLKSQSYPPALYVGSSTVSKVYSGSVQVWPATGFYDCGYGCQYYASAPACSTCNPTANNVLHGLYIGTNNNTLNYYITLSNNYSSSSINYVLKISTSRPSGPITTGTMNVPGYTIDTFFSGTTSSFGVVHLITDTFTVTLSNDNGVSFTAQITPASGTLNTNY